MSTPPSLGAEQVGLTFLVPAWNEESNIDRTVDEAVVAGTRLIECGRIDSFEVVVVDDGSTDRTPSLLAARSREDLRIRLVRHAANRGLGAALRSGFDVARGRLVLYTDADLPFDLFEVDRALRLMNMHGADVVAAYRHDRTTEGPRRLLYSVVYNLMVRLALGVVVRDVNFAAKIVSSEVLEAVTLQSEGSFIDAELLARARVAGFHMIQIGVDYFPRSNGRSKLSDVATIRKLVREMIVLSPQIRRRSGRGS